MLTDKDYLLLCEIANNGILNINKANIGEIVRLLISEDKCEYRELLKEVSSSSILEELKLIDSKMVNNIKVFILQDLLENIFVVFVGEENLQKINDKCFEGIFDYVKQNVNMEKFFITGLNKGGAYAAYIASKLEAQAVVFGVPCFEELPGILRYL